MRGEASREKEKERWSIVNAERRGGGEGERREGAR